MQSSRLLDLFDRRVGFVLASMSLLLGMVLPSVFPAFASADNQVASRSIALSSSAANASGVTYSVTFTPVTSDSPGYVTLIFCDDSPIIGQSCNAPAGFNAASATIGTGSTDGSAAINGTAGANYVVVSSALVASTPVTIVLDGIHNPTNATTSSTGFYARIQTYAGASDAQSAATTADTPGSNLQDSGGLAMAITSAVGITAAVRETMTFCVSHSAPDINCTSTDPPSLTLGHGTPQALDATAFDTGDDYAQISTNAVNGAVVSLKNNNNCGGLKRSSATGCDIAPAGSGDPIAAGTAKFGMKLGSQTTLTGGSGTISPSSDFAGTGGNYGMTFPSGNGSGVSGVYGAQVFDTSSAPINNVNVKMTFAASASNITPAGLYQATLSMIATGTF